MTTAGEPIQVCLLGFGLAGRVFHAPFLSAVPGLRLASVVSSRIDEVQRLWPGTPVFASLETALSSTPAELVVVATPNQTHFDLASRALVAGRHVVVDKPVAATSEEIRTLATMAEERGRLLAPFHNRRWDGDFLTLKQLLQAGTLGRLVSFSSRFDRFRPLVRTGNWKEAPSQAHGLLMDLGPHLVDQVLALWGLPQSIAGSVRTERDETGIEDAFDLSLEYPGLFVRLGSSLLAADPQPRFLAHGTRGSYRKTGVDPQEPTLVSGRATVPPLNADAPWLPESSDAWGELTVVPDAAQPDVRQRTRLETLPGDYRQFYRNVRDAIRGDSTLEVTVQDAWRTVRLLELARESSQTGQRLRVDFA